MKKELQNSFINSSLSDKNKSAAHDLNNLLNNILNAIELIKESVYNDLKLLNLSTHIEKNTILATEIVQELSGKKDISTSNKSKLDLLNIALEVKALIDEGANKDLKIEIINDKNNYWITGYPTELKRLLLNLITNSIEAKSNNLNIKIYFDLNSYHDGQKTVSMSLVDNGPGIPQNILNDIFNKGFSSKNANTNHGLGLTIVRDIVEKHSGTISVESNSDKGTTFHINFPSIEMEIERFKNLEHKRIIIAEDDKFQREVLKDLLKSMKIDVFTASSGVEAVDLFISSKPDLLFIDETMPGMTGLQCSEKINELGNLSPIVLVTGADIDEKTLDGKVSKVLKKPYSFTSVKETLNDLLK